MGSHHDFDAAHWDHEPVAIPLTRPSDTLSPSGGEGGGEGARFMESCGDSSQLKIGATNVMWIFADRRLKSAVK